MKALLAIGLVMMSACAGSTAPPASAPVLTASVVVDGPSARLLQRLPAGIASPDASRLYWLGGGSLHASDTATGAEVSSTQVAPGSAVAGLSPRGDTLVLTDPGGHGTRFSAFDPHHLDRRPPVADLTANYEFDAISDGGRNLYLIERKEQAGPGRYSVTVYWYSGGGLCHCTVVDKTEPGTTLMRGTRVMSVPAPGGSMLFTLYDGGGHDGAFIHALSLEHPVAWCVDLPAAPGNTEGWQIGLSAGGEELLAVNLAAGLAVRADITRSARNEDKPVISAVVRFAPSPGPAPGQHGLLAAPDHHNLLVLAEAAVVVLDSSSLEPRGRLLAGLWPVALGSSPDGQWQYGLTAAGKVARLNPLDPTPAAFPTGLEAPQLVVR